MRIPARRMTLTAFSALAATALFATPALATVFHQGISLRPEARITADGSVVLSGTYQCELSPASAAIQIKATVVQDATRLSIGAGEVFCDGREHIWEAVSPMTGGLHPGAARAVAELQEIHMTGLMPRALSTVAEDRQDIEVTVDHR
ncbi:hypothetical protein EDD96_4859 [Streptomyces sp. Ag109_G2-6]|uniref:DUF6299 family protein n=1 Tax=Streptomyces TaxID=1883 RepID=UPI000CC63E25|nr:MULTISPECIES: DUF6299 family protein [Streptomyces]RPF41069.1 hypothetical protein EDD96_4859 [Streptomyces sp. Ag109_G2-6]